MDKKSRMMLVLIVSIAFLVFLAFASTTKSVYADELSGPFMPGPDSVTPGDDGGNSPPNTFEGWVREYGVPSSPVSGVNVYLCGYLGPIYANETTDPSGYFKFDNHDTNMFTGGSLLILPNHEYFIEVNGYYDVVSGIDPAQSLGFQCDNPAWGQWSKNFTTDSTGYATTTVCLSRSAVVDVTSAALFSNTQYATLTYVLTQGHTVSHSLGFHLSAGLGVDTGYTTSETVEFSVAVTTLPNEKVHVSQRHYAASYWDSSGIYGNPPSIIYSGIAGKDKTWGIDRLTLSADYLDSNSLPPDSYVDHRIDPGGPITFSYSESGQYTWKTGTAFGISYMAFGMSLSLETTVSTYSTCTVSYTIQNTSGQRHRFRAYTCGATLNPSSTGGMELHVWDMGVST